jgi:putative transposase
MYSAQDLANITRTSRQTLSESAKNALENGRDTITTKGKEFYVRKNGRRYEFSAAPFKEAPMGAGVSLNGACISDSKNEDMELIPTPSPVRFADPDEQAAYDALDDKERKTVDFKVRVTAAYRRHKVEKEAKSLDAFLAHWRDHYRLELERCGLVLRREYLYRWERVYEAEGNAGFMKKKGRQKGSHTVPEWALQKLEEIFWAKNGRIRNKNLYRLLNTEAFERGELSTEAYKRTIRERNVGGIISLTRIGEITRELKASRAYKATINPDAYKNTMLPGFGDMREKANFANQYWEIDSTKLDAFGKDANGETTWSIIAISDVKTAMKVASIVKNSNAHGIAELFYKAFGKLGIPENVVTDNGKDYLSNHIIELLDRLGCKHHRTAPYAGEQKPFAERHFGTLQNAFTELLNGFKGHSVSEMQAINALTSTPERLSGRVPEKATEPVRDIAAKLEAWIDNVYAHEYNRGLGCSPYESYAEDESFVTRMDMRGLAYAFGKRFTRVVGKSDGISVGNVKYNNIDGKLGNRVGDRVEVAIDLADANVCYVFEADKAIRGRYICTATTEKMTEAGIKEAKRLYREEIKGFKAMVNRAKKAVEGRDFVQEIIDANKRAFGNLTPIEEIGGDGVVQNGGNIRRAVDIGKQISDDLEAEMTRNERPDIGRRIAFEDELEPEPEKKIIGYDDIIRQRLASGE